MKNIFKNKAKSLRKILFALILISNFIGYSQCWQTVSSSGYYSLAIKTDGTLWAWGENNGGQLGDGTTINRNIPSQVGTANDWKSISTSINCAFAIKQNGTLWSWGFNYNGRLGNGSTSNTNFLLPTQVGTANNWKIVMANSGGCIHAIKTDGTLWGWGYNIFGCLGNGVVTSNVYSPIQIGTANDWKTIYNGVNYSLAIKNNGTLWAWGNNPYGNLGDGTSVNRSSPIQVGVDNDWNSISASGGYYVSAAIKNNGKLYTWGLNSNYALGDGTNINRNTPTLISSANSWKFVSIGYIDSSFAIKTDGTIWAWGTNSNGQFGNSTTTNSIIPSQIGTQNDWQTVSVGNRFSLLIKNNSTLYGSGDNTFGQLGSGNNNNSTTFLQTITTCSTPLSPIIANDDVANIVSGTASTPISNVRVNDTFNGVAATSTNTVLSSISSTNTGITLNTTTGAINVAANVLAGTYTLTYQICEVGNTSNCDTAIVTITVVAPQLVANSDSATTMFGVASTPISNVRANDTFNGAVATSSNTTLSFVSSTNTGITLNASTGAVNVAANVPVGTYTLTYKICAVASPATCVNGIVTITVVAPQLVANSDSATTMFGVASTPISNVRANDTFNGAVATSSNTTLSFVSSTNTGITLNASTGAVNVAANVPVGTYTLTYRICAVVSPTTCVNGVVTITVAAPQLVANSDSATTMFGVASIPISNVRANDTFNGAVATSSNTTLSFVSSTNAGITLNASTGAVNVAANVPVGTYTLTYRICAVVSPTTCVNGVVTITVAAPQLVANSDSATIIFGGASMPISNVRANDTFNGAVATSSNTTLSFVSSTNAGILLITSTGAINVAANVPVGTYTLTYRICAIASPTTCVNGIVTITITAPQLVANSDSGTAMFGVAGVSISNVRANDTFNGAVATASNTNLSLVSSTSSGILLNTTTGSIYVNANVPVGTYTLKYRICAVSSPTVCVIGTVTIIVSPPVLITNPDIVITTFGVNSIPNSSVLSNDTYNGVTAAALINVELTLVSTTHPGILLSSTSGGVAVHPTTVPPGTYYLVYKICAINNLSVCTNGTVTVIVNPPVLVANPDLVTVQSGVTSTSNINVRSNDTYNGTSAIVQNSILSFVSSTHQGISLNISNGLITISSTVPVGTYSLVYKICASGSPTTCTNGIVTVKVIPQQLLKGNEDTTNSTSIESFSLMKNTLDDENLIVYPNPSNGVFTINLENVNEKYETIEVYNLFGAKVFSETVNNRSNVTIDLSQFSSGYYIAKVKNDEKTVQLKLIKQ
ncbi:T9SS type A sorting domain-containing protein [Flavobacterium sp.]|jgi:alpha-tubulin suppressor-like RCC1 family protein/uncharacterized protein involved in high-affinity Fe2+ transport|uniref:T9SS type A sorting domain-containing protein n=1 Tax=Flavobacterium sp. TaxID=239 RepID=UPI0037C019A2